MDKNKKAWSCRVNRKCLEVVSPEVVIVDGERLYGCQTKKAIAREEVANFLSNAGIEHSCYLLQGRRDTTRLREKTAL